MKHVVVGLAMGLVFSAASAQQVWRCEQDGQVRYTDQPCEKSGRPLPTPASGVAPVAAAGELPASAALAVADEVAPAQPASAPQASASNRRAHRGKRAAAFAMQGLMDTDFVQRGYVPKRQNPLLVTNP